MRFLGLYVLMLLMAPATALAAEAPLRCAVCQALISGKYYWMAQPAVEKQAVCLECWKFPNRCATCRLPISRDGRQLDDGRWLCRQDSKDAILSSPEALRIYEEAQRDASGILAGLGTAPRRNITVSLVNATRLKDLNQALPSDHEEQTLLGLTRTKSFGNKEHQHQIYLLSGLSPVRLSAVAAHEYTHAWLHENLPPGRDLNRDTVEGFCELVAYKVMSQRGEEQEKKVILANAYTRGQVNAFVQAQASHHFQRIVKWIKTGIDDVLPNTNAVPVLATREETSTVVWPPPARLLTPVPDVLTLRGIAGRPGRRFVLINDRTLTNNEEGLVRLGSTNVTVRCLDIRDHSALIQIQGAVSVTELFLGSN